MGLERLRQKLHLGRPKGKVTPKAAHEGAAASERPPSGSNLEVHKVATDPPHALEKPTSSSNSSDVSIRELWNVAYERLREEDGELVQRYEEELLPGNLTAALGSNPGAKISRREQMDAILKRKVDEVTREVWKLRFGSSEVPVRDLAEPVLSVVAWANEYITDAVSANAYASIAWSGVSLLLPLLLNPSKQVVSLANGLKYITSLIVQSRMWEDLYSRRYEAKTETQESRPVSHAQYKNALEALYRTILKYQVTSYCYYARNSAFRLGLDMVKWDDWVALLDDIREEERVFTAVSTIWRDMKYDEEREAMERRHRETVTRWDAIGLDVQGLRKAVEGAQADSKRSEILRWLSDVDPSVTYNIARKKHGSGTGEWLLNNSKEFQTWQESRGSLLWLHGKAGLGKSVLSSSVIKHLRDRHASDPETALAYFYFSFTDPKKQNVVEMLSSLVKQLCSRRPDTPRPIKDLAQYKERGERPDIETLEAALTATICGFTAVHIVIDGLDECPALNGERGTLLDTLCRTVATAPDCVHFLLTSRKEADIDAAIGPLLSPPARNSVDLAKYRQYLDRDIGLYIDSTLASREYSSWPDNVKAEVRNTLVGKADGMFQYVSCQFDELRNVKSIALVRKTLHDLPAGLDTTYDRMLQRIDPDFQQQVVSMLKWLCYCEYHLTVKQLAEIFILQPHETITLENLESERLFDVRDVLQYLGSFVVVAGTEPWAGVFLAHFSIKEYLTSQRALQGPAAALSFSEVDARVHIAFSCLQYLVNVTCTENPWDIASPRNPLSECAAWEWMVHLEILPWKSWPGEVIDVVKRALATRSQSLFCAAVTYLAIEPRFIIGLFEADLHANDVVWQPHRLVAWLGLRQVTEMIISTTEYLTQEDLDTALHEAAGGGERRLVELLLNRGADVNGKAAPLGDALHAAVWHGHTEVGRLLLDKGADINSRHRGRSPLQAAAARGHINMVKLLVGRGADICNEQACAVASAAESYSVEVLRFLLDRSAGIKGTHSTALHKAISGMEVYSWHLPGYAKHLPFVLLERGVDVNAWGGEEHGYPLHVAYRNHEPDLAELLVEKGASIHTIGGKYGSALQAACGSRNARGLVESLLEKGVDVNAQGGEYGNALQAACCNPDYGNVDTVRMLLDHGADINASGGVFGNALQAAAKMTSNPEIVKLLLKRGANVNKQGGKYGSALQAAVAVQDLVNVQILLDHGAEVNAQGGEYGTAFQAACVPWADDDSTVNDGAALSESVHVITDIARLLLDHGADVHIQGGRFGSAWHAAAAARIRYPQWEELMQLLLDKGVDINDGRGRLQHAPTALHAVLQTRDPWSAPRKLDFLLEHGADPNLSAGTYGLPLQAACAAYYANGRFTFSETRVRYFLDKWPEIDVNAPGGLFGCALQAAAYSGQTKSVELLLSKGADVNLRGGKYGSALNAAIVKGYWDLVDVLLRAGAEPDCWHLSEPDEEWLKRVREEDGRGAVERYRKFWEKQMEKARA